MAQEQVIIVTTVFSLISALAGISLTWILNSISSEDKDRRLEREAARRRLEDIYIQIRSDIELYLRSSRRDFSDINERLSNIGAKIRIMAHIEVIAAFGEFEDAMLKFEHAIGQDARKPLFKYQIDFNDEWVSVVAALSKLTDAMVKDIERLRNF